MEEKINLFKIVSQKIFGRIWTIINFYSNFLSLLFYFYFKALTDAYKRVESWIITWIDTKAILTIDDKEKFERRILINTETRTKMNCL
jgi:hypothetical protein